MEKERIAEFREFIKDTEIPEEGIQWLIDNGFFIAPASSKYHLCYEGGLYEHSKNVADTLIKFGKDLNFKWQRASSPYIIGLLHDVCKIDQYVFDKDKKQYVWNEKQSILGHGDKSVKLINEHIIKLTDEEKECILNHMGAFTTDRAKWAEYTNAINKYHSVLLTHSADVYATHVLER